MACGTSLTWARAPEFIRGKETVAKKIDFLLQEASLKRFACKAFLLITMLGMTIFGVVSGIRSSQSITNRIIMGAAFGLASLVVLALLIKRIVNVMAARSQIQADERIPGHPLLASYLKDTERQIVQLRRNGIDIYHDFESAISQRLFQNN